MSQAGVSPLTEVQLRNPVRASIGALPNDGQLALVWLRRGPLVTSPLLPLFLRRALLRLGGVKIGKLVYGLDRCYFGSPRISIGSGSYVNSGCWFEGAGKIEIESDCMLGPQVMIVTSTHEIGDGGRIERKSGYQPVRIERGSWLGARAMVLPGVTIGAGAIIAAGAVVTKDCEPGGRYAGVPARRIR